LTGEASEKDLEELSKLLQDDPDLSYSIEVLTNYWVHGKMENEKPNEALLDRIIKRNELNGRKKSKITIMFKTSIRNLWKNKSYSLLNIFGLAIGIACAGLIFLWTRDELSWDNNNVNKKNLYEVRENVNYAGSIFTNGSTPRPMAAALKTEIPGIDNTCRVSEEEIKALFSVNDKPMYASGRYADTSLFSMFTIPFVQGNAASAFDQLHSIVITQSTVQKFFGDETNVIGKTVRVNNRQDYIVTGVVKDMPKNASLQFEWVAPYEVSLVENNAYENGDAASWESYGPLTYVQLDPQANLAAINSKLYHYIHSKNATQTAHAFLFPMRDWHLYDEFVNGKQTGGGQIEQVRMLSVIAWIILLVACINFMNLATARSEQRAKEVGVRKVLGSGKGRLILQFLGESFLMSAIAAALAVIIIAFALPAFNQLTQKQLSLQPGNPVHVIALLSITVICGLVAGSYPSLYLSSFNPIGVLKGFKIKTGSAAAIRKGLVILQFTISVVFIISTIVVYSQIQHIKDRKLGFNKSNLIEIDMQHNIYGNFPLIKNDLLHAGIAENVALTNHTVLYGGDTDNRFAWQGKPANEDVSIAFRNVSPEFVATSGMHIVDGKDFNADGASNHSSVLISESLAKILGKGSAVGKIIQSPRGQETGKFENLTVIGVVSDYVFGNIYGKSSGPLLLFCKPSQDANLLYLRLKPQTNVERALSRIREVMKKDNPAYPLQFQFVDDQFNNMFLNMALTSKLSTLFAVLAIVISCFGLFGWATYAAERRIKEIGIRKVLGASVAGITALLSKDFLQLVAIACFIAFPVAWWMMHSWLQNYEYRIGMSWWIFLLAGSSAILIALVTISFQSVKAAIANPVKSLRTE
jgi:predicted permease